MSETTGTAKMSETKLHHKITKLSKILSDTMYMLSLLRANGKNANLSVILAGRSAIQANLQSATQANQSANRL